MSDRITIRVSRAQKLKLKWLAEARGISITGLLRPVVQARCIEADNLMAKAKAASPESETALPSEGGFSLEGEPSQETKL